MKHKITHFSPTSLEDATCPRLYWFKKFARIKAKKESLAPFFGTCMHAAVGAYYTNKCGGSTFVDAKKEAVQAFVAEWDTGTVVPNPKKNQTLESGIIISGAYCDFYEHDETHFYPEDIEQMCTVEMPDGSKQMFKLDRKWFNNDCLYVVDTKTAGQNFTPFYWNQFTNNFQTGMYMLLMQQMHPGEKHYSVLIDGISLKGKTPMDTFQRREFQRTPYQLEQVWNTYVQKTKLIKEAAEKETRKEQLEIMYQEHTSCKDWGGCEYLNVCTYGFDHPDMKTIFEVKQNEN